MTKGQPTKRPRTPAKPAPVQGKRPRGGQTVYTREIADRICFDLSRGMTLSQVCRQDGMPSRATVLGWVLEDRDGFAVRYAGARDLMLEHWADELIDVADDATNDWMSRQDKSGETSLAFDHEHVQRSRLRVDSRKWLLSKLKPERYGERIQQEITGKDGRDLLPEREPRDLARAVLGILRQAKISDQPRRPASTDAGGEIKHEPVAAEPARSSVAPVATERSARVCLDAAPVAAEQIEPAELRENQPIQRGPRVVRRPQR